MRTPFQKHKKDEEAKKRRDEEETARMLEEFQESFKGDVASGKAFVRGGMINPNERLKADSEGGNSKDGVSLSKKGSRYVPTFLLPISKGKETDKKEDEKKKENERGKSRVIDKYLEEIKMGQELREKRSHDRDQRHDGRHGDISAPISHLDELPDVFDSSGKFPGSFDDGDPQTTNLYVGNLSPQVDENFLLRTFGRFGPIASVKIMWPRTEEERRKLRNCGFVAFMNRADAQAAKDEMQGVVVYEYELKIGWGKSVPLPAQALPAPPPGQMAIRNKEGGTVILSGPDSAPVSSVSGKSSDLVLTPNVPDIMVVPPADDHLRCVIDTMALYVLDGGCAFEQAIMERGRGNSLFSFLFDLRSNEHTYYVWRLYSFAQGDTLQRWRTEPFIMITGSGRWIPPSLPQRDELEEKGSATTFASGRSKRVELERSLTDSQRDEFEDMLRALTLERSQIKDAMGFALDNADAAGEIVEVLTESLTLKETLIPTKVARLMLVSDILHNSSAPVKNASAYRTKFEATLPDIIESFNDLYRGITGRITAEALKERVLKVLQVWADWFLFSDAYVNGLRATFLRSGNSGVIPFHSICGDAPEVDASSGIEELSEGVRLNQDAALAIGKGAAMRELLGLPPIELERRCRHNGLSLRGGKEMMVARLLSLEDAEKQRVYERNDDLRFLQTSSGKLAEGDSGGWSVSNSGEEVHGSEKTPDQHISRRIRGHDNVSYRQSSNPIPGVSNVEQASVVKKDKPDPVLPVSKWSRDDDGSDVDNNDEARGLGLGYSSLGSKNVSDDYDKEGETEVAANVVQNAFSDNSTNEEHRQKLRRLEVALIEYREYLEERGIHNKVDELEKKVESRRRRLLSEFGLADSSGGQSPVRLRRRDGSVGHESSRKRTRSPSPSRSPPAIKSSDRDQGRRSDRSRDKDRDQDRHRDGVRSRSREHEKSGNRERDEHERGERRTRERSKDKRK